MSTQYKTVLAALHSQNHKPTKSGNGYLAHCPAHPDKTPSLSINEGSGGKALLTCHAGCSFQSVISALNLKNTLGSKPAPTPPKINAQEVINRVLTESKPASAGHPYLTRKQIPPTNLKELPIEDLRRIINYHPKSEQGERLEGTVLIGQLNNSKGERSLQFIDGSGRKSFLARVTIKGKFWGKIPESTQIVFAAEGIATIASIRESVKDHYPNAAFIAVLTANNFEPVVAALANNHQVVICADRGNGEEAARQSAQKHNCPCIVPQFTQLDGELTDFNDLFIINPDEIYRQITITVQSDFFHSKKAPQAPQAPQIVKKEDVTYMEVSTSNLHKLHNYILFNYLSIFLESENEEGRKRLLPQSKAAERIEPILKDHFAIDEVSREWYQFAGSYWDNTNAADKLDHALSQIIETATPTLGYSVSYINNIKSLIEMRGRLKIAADQTNHIPFLNGLLDIRKKELIPVTPQNATTWCIPFNYDQNAKCPNTLEWLYQVTNNDHELVNFLFVWIAAILRGRADLQKFLHVIGPGGTGKSTFIRLCSEIVGTRNTISTTLKELEINRFETASLYGKRLAVITDSDKYGGSVNVIKALTGQDEIRIERKNVQRNNGFIYNGMIMIASNEALQTTDYTSGLDRRRITVEFKRRIKSTERIAWERRGGFEKILQPEIPGIINHALLIDNEEISETIYNPPQSITQANTEAAAQNNPILAWIFEWIIPDPNARTPIGIKKESKDHTTGLPEILNSADHLYPSYLQYCKEIGKISISCHRFSPLLIDQLETLNIKVSKIKSSNCNYIRGIRLRQEHERQYNWM